MESTMPWTDITRDDCASEAVRYARSDLSNAEWTAIVPPMPVGCPRKADLREVVNAILHMASTGCQWRMLPKDFQPFTTAQRCRAAFYGWRDGRPLRTISNSLVVAARERERRQASPSAGIVDGQSVKTTKSRGIPGFDAGKKVNGRKRHIVTVTPTAAIRDRSRNARSRRSEASCSRSRHAARRRQGL
ncbi:transposase IS4 family protein [Mesorhizobium alhagi CCNWXJ12-2]|uniref:Transposase IS4 family protein n=1 Tax=Mesorhizobium alhagi CCNWXJ12-2 TaxID=1107882 RepID=H0I1P7_9HYPH|nr:transposase IS4 family protein [Mesorhizobium alhagi CCNWXJ12-2]